MARTTAAATASGSPAKGGHGQPRGHRGLDEAGLDAEHAHPALAIGQVEAVEEHGEPGLGRAVEIVAAPGPVARHAAEGADEAPAPRGQPHRGLLAEQHRAGEVDLEQRGQARRIGGQLLLAAEARRRSPPGRRGRPGPIGRVERVREPGRPAQVERRVADRRARPARLEVARGERHLGRVAARAGTGRRRARRAPAPARGPCRGSRRRRPPSRAVPEEPDRLGGAEAVARVPAVAHRAPLGQARHHAREVLGARHRVLGEVDRARRGRSRARSARGSGPR